MPDDMWNATAAVGSAIESCRSIRVFPPTAVALINRLATERAPPGDHAGFIEL